MLTMFTRTHLIATAAGLAIALGGGENCRSIEHPVSTVTPPVTEADTLDRFFHNRLAETPPRVEFVPHITDSALPPTGPHVPINATWTMTWDDDVNGVVIGAKTCNVELRAVNGVLAGVFDGPVFGENREAVFSGDVVEVGGSTLIIMRQDEPGYSCVYAGAFDASGTITGTWFDTRGARGDFTMGDPVAPRFDESHRE